jgi:cytochrome c553
MPEWPALAGQVAAYIEQQLRLFRVGERINPQMAPIATSLTDDDIADLAAYYAAQSPQVPASPPPEPSAAAGLYLNGDAARTIVPCASCHGPDGRGNVATITPALRSQQATYIRAQLTAYALRGRYQSAVPDGLQPAGVTAMYDGAARLTDDEVRELAQYLQSLP